MIWESVLSTGCLIAKGNKSTVMDLVFQHKQSRIDRRRDPDVDRHRQMNVASCNILQYEAAILKYDLRSEEEDCRMRWQWLSR